MKHNWGRKSKCKRWKEAIFNSLREEDVRNLYDVWQAKVNKLSNCLHISSCHLQLWGYEQFWLFRRNWFGPIYFCQNVFLYVSTSSLIMQIVYPKHTRNLIPNWTCSQVTQSTCISFEWQWQPARMFGVNSVYI